MSTVRSVARFNCSFKSWKLGLMLAICSLSLAQLITCAARSPARLQRQIVLAGDRASGPNNINPAYNGYLPPEQQQNVLYQQLDDFPLYQDDKYPPINNPYNPSGIKQRDPAWPGFGGAKGAARNPVAGVKY